MMAALGVGLLPSGAAGPLDSFPCTILSPFPKIPPHGAPRREVMRHARHVQPLRRTYTMPLTTSRRQYAAFPRSWLMGVGKLNIPLFVGQVAGVVCVSYLHSNTCQDFSHTLLAGRAGPTAAIRRPRSWPRTGEAYRSARRRRGCGASPLWGRYRRCMGAMR